MQRICKGAKAAMDAALARLLDFSQPVDVRLFDEVVTVFNTQQGTPQVCELRGRQWPQHMSLYLLMNPSLPLRSRSLICSIYLASRLDILCVHVQGRAAEAILTQFKEHPNSWQHADSIIENSTRWEAKVTDCA
jgi:hypothetical protein